MTALRVGRRHSEADELTGRVWWVAIPLLSRREYLGPRPVATPFP